MRSSYQVRNGCRVVTGLCLLLACLSGCGGNAQKTGTVLGKVSIGDTPLATGYVNFEDPSHGIGASAKVTDGAYAFDTPLNIGNYSVSVQPPSLVPSAAPATGPAKDAIPDRYLQTASSPLKATVVEGENKMDFKLEK